MDNIDQQHNPEMARALERAGHRYRVVEDHAIPNLAEAVGNNYAYPKERDEAARRATEDQVFADNIDRQVQAEAPAVVAAAEQFTAAAVAALEEAQKVVDHTAATNEVQQTAANLEQARATLDAIPAETPPVEFGPPPAEYETQAPASGTLTNLHPDVSQALGNYLPPESMN